MEVPGVVTSEKEIVRIMTPWLRGQERVAQPGKRHSRYRLEEVWTVLLTQWSEADVSATELLNLLRSGDLRIQGGFAVTFKVEALLELLSLIQVKIPEPAGVRDYLLSNSDIIDLLPPACRMAREQFGVGAELSLELYRDPEIEDEYLTLYVRQRRYDENMLGKIEELCKAYETVLSSRTGWFILTTDFRPPHHHWITRETGLAAQARGLAERLDLLREIDFMKVLTPDLLSRLASLLKVLFYDAGRDIVRQDDEGDSFFLVSRGRVGVWVRDAQNEEQLVATLGRGQCFGEMSLLTGARRSARVSAVEDSELLMLGKAEFREILLADPKIVESLSQLLSLRQREQETALIGGRSTAPQLREQDPAGQLLVRIRSFFGI